MPAPPLLRLDDVALTFGGTPLLEGATAQVLPGDRIGLVGRNGSGKSTLLKIMAGLVEPQAGEVFRQPRATVGMLAQEPDMGGHATVEDFVAAAMRLEGVAGDEPHRARVLLNDLGLSGAEDPARLSGGEARRAALAAALAREPDVLLLDEPTNHLDLPTIEWLESHLARARSALVTISHDRRFLGTVTNAVLWLDRGEVRRLDRGFEAFEDWRDRLVEEEETAHHKLGRKIVREQHWIVHGVSGRRKRNMRRVAELAALRDAYRARRTDGRVEATVAEAKAGGKIVIEAKGIAKSFPMEDPGENGTEGARRDIVRDFSIRIARGDRIGLVGPNGAGKTTLLNMLTGALAPDAGTVRIARNAAIATLDQRRAALDPDETVADFLTEGKGDAVSVAGEPRHVMTYLKEWLFLPAQARTPIGALSGGERARLLLASVLAKPADLLVLDEPTNDLDMETLDLLQETIANYAGTVLLVSHDRDFLDRTVTATLAPAADGRARWLAYAGGYADMLAQRRAEVADDRARSGRSEGAKGGNASGTGEGSGGGAPEPPRRRAAKLSFKHAHALETLPGRIDEANEAAVAIEAEMSDPALFGRDPDRFAALSARLAERRSAIEAMEEAWMEAEMAREALGD